MLVLMWLDKVASSFITKIHNPILSHNIIITQNRVIMIELKQKLTIFQITNKKITMFGQSSLFSNNLKN
jgi:hypothetical protein